MKGLADITPGKSLAGLYLHIPFCEQKCIYCDFYSIENLRGMETFLHSLEEEITLHAEYSHKTMFETVFFGGGTPSLLSPVQLERILSRLYSKFSIIPTAEITVETNPGTANAEKLKDYRSLGVNRLSVGIQSFHDDELRFLTRIHSAQQARECIGTAQRVGFENVNVDLIFALPGQTMERWLSNLRQAVALQTQHISAYSLIVEPGTPLARMVAAKQVSPLPAEEDAEMYERTMEVLDVAGYEQYEVSNFARPGFRCRHNGNYWNHGNYLGFGPSAHAFWNSGKAKRWWNIANLSTYIEKLNNGVLPVAGEETLGENELVEEAIMLGLRSDGIDLQRLSERYGVPLGIDAHPSIAQFLDDGFAIMRNGKLSLTRRGYLLCDEIAQNLLARLECVREEAVV